MPTTPPWLTDVCFLHQLLDRDEFRFITKIKTIGSTYMAASGLTPESNTNEYSNRKVWHLKRLLLYTLLLVLHMVMIVKRCAVVPQPEDQSLFERWQHLADLADFALAMQVTLNNLNKQSFNNFMLRIG